MCAGNVRADEDAQAEPDAQSMNELFRLMAQSETDYVLFFRCLADEAAAWMSQRDQDGRFP